MSLPALAPATDTRSIVERVNVLIRNVYNKVIPVGAANTTLISDGSTLAWQPDKRVLQIVSTQTGAVATGTTVMSLADTIPQNTDGDQYMSLAITPKSATSKLTIDIVWIGTSSSANNMIVALFQDSTANALLATTMRIEAATGINTTSFRHVMTSGTTNATTFKVRAGGSVAGTTTFNGTGGARIFGGVMASSIVIREVL